MQGWVQRQQALQSLAQSQLFFVGGAPRSGTTWLQLLLDSHPDVCCRGEGLFLKHAAEPLQKLMAERRNALEAKHKGIFSQFEGFPLPESDDVDQLTGTMILLALERLCAGRAYRAIGEKTPENVFFFARLKDLFPKAKFIGIARDPRDVLSSAWHFFRKPQPNEDNATAKKAFIHLALPSLQRGAHATLALVERYPSDSMVITYERLSEAPAVVAGQLFRFLGVSDADDLIAACTARTSFRTLSGGRAPGMARDGTFFRKGVVGDWPETFGPEMNEMILRELGWMFPRFGWKP